MKGRLMIERMVGLMRRSRVVAGAIGLAAAASPVVGHGRGNNGNTDKERGKGDGEETERQRARNYDNDSDEGRNRRSGRDDNDRSTEEAQNSGRGSDTRRQSAEEDGGGGDRDIVGGRIGEVADRLRQRGEKLTGANGSGGGDDEPNISVIRDADGAITIDTGNIFFESAPDPDPFPFPFPGFPAADPGRTPRPDGGDNNVDMVS